MKMTIEIRGLRIYSHHGCYEEERRVGTTFVIDADLEVDATRPASTDDVADALNYVEACEAIAGVMRREHHLLEALAADMAEVLRSGFASKGLAGGWVKISKLSPPIGMEMASVAVKADI